VSFPAPLFIHLHIRYGLLHGLQGLVVLPQRGDFAVLVLDGTLGAEALGAAVCLRNLVIVPLLGPLEALSVELAAYLSQLAERSHRVGGISFQSRFELVSLGATAFEAVAEFERAAVALAAVFVRGAVTADAGCHGVY